METNKRKRATEWWHETVDWIVRNGGRIHEGILWSEERRELVTTKDVASGSILMVIPNECLISLETTCFENVCMDTSGLFNEKQDVLIAAFLAIQRHDGAGAFQNYLNTLPDSASFDSLPRRWPDEKQDKLLTGTTLLDRIKKAHSGARDDFDQVQKALNNPMLIFSTFDDMLAAVTSRAFAGLGASSRDQDIAMVPLLDLCNHRRGNITKNLSYRRTEKYVEVTSCVDISQDSMLSTTYGAKGNAQLLINYGFCIMNNLEPDGSSNDIIELQLKVDQLPVEMRTGPKRFTFGPLCKALELFHLPINQGITENEDQDEMDSFSDEDDETDEMMYGGITSEVFDEVEYKNEQQRMIKTELEALNGLEIALGNLLAGYSMTNVDILQHLASEQFSSNKFAATLVYAEKRTINFLQLTIILVRAILLKVQPAPFNWLFDLTCGDKRLLKKQAEELAAAFVRIRFSELF